jgi:parvulin-like peptidyl-prolyl isomerase
MRRRSASGRSVAAATIGCVALLAGLSACGGAGGAIIARVGRERITKDMLSQMIMKLTPEHVALEPPKFAKCVVQQRAASVITVDEAVLRRECEQLYALFEKRALDSLITDYWRIDEALSRHLIDSGQVGTRPTPAADGSEAEAAAIDGDLAALADAAAVRLTQVSERRGARVAEAQAAAYYRRHIDRYERGELRYIDLAENFASASRARLARLEVEAGTRLASISLHEVIEGSNIVGGRYTTKAARSAIFAAKPHVLTGPIKLNRDYAIFELTRIVAPRREPFARVRGQIIAQLEHQRRTQALAHYVAAWRRRWTARTSCESGYVIQRCREYRGARAPEDPLAFN